LEATEVIEAFRDQLKQVEAQGDGYVSVSAIKSYLFALERDASATQEHRNREHQGLLAHYAAKNEHSIEMLKAVLEAGKSALHYLLLINGGAVVALLGVLSNLAGKSGGTPFAKYLALPLVQFGIGVLLAALGFALRYFSQACYLESASGKEPYQKWGDAFRYTAILATLTGYALFGVAISNAYHAVIWSF